MGLLDNLFATPSDQALWALGSGLFGVRRGNEGRAMMGALGAYNDAQQQQRRNELVDLQRRQIEAQMADRSAKTQAEAEELLRRQRFFSELPSRLNMPLPGGPTVANAQAQGTIPPALFADAYQLGIKPDELRALSGQTEVKDYKNVPGATGPEVASFDKWGNVRKTGQQAWVADLDPNVQASRFKNAQASAPRIDISMDRGFGEVFAKNAAEGLDKSRNAAQAASSSLSTLQRMSQAIEGGAIAGPGSSFAVFGLQLGEVLGVSGKDAQEKLKNTRTLIQGAASLGLDGAKAMQGQGQVSNYERQLVERASSGDISGMGVSEFKVLIDVLNRVHRSTIGRHREALKKVPPQFAPYMPMYEVDEPQGPQVINFEDLKKSKEK